MQRVIDNDLDSWRDSIVLEWLFSLSSLYDDYLPFDVQFNDQCDQEMEIEFEWDEYQVNLEYI